MNEKERANEHGEQMKRKATRKPANTLNSYISPQSLVCSNKATTSTIYISIANYVRAYFAGIMCEWTFIGFEMLGISFNQWNVYSNEAKWVEDVAVACLLDFFFRNFRSFCSFIFTSEHSLPTIDESIWNSLIFWLENQKKTQSFCVGWIQLNHLSKPFKLFINIILDTKHSDAISLLLT